MMKLLKKDQFDLSRKVVYSLLVRFVLAFMVIYMNSVIKSGNLRDISLLGKSSGNLFVAELLTSPNCFAYFDEDIGRVYPGVINEEKRNEDSLESCGKYFRDHFSISVADKKIGDAGFSGKMFSRPVILSNGSLEEVEIEVQNA